MPSPPLHSLFSTPLSVLHLHSPAPFSISILHLHSPFSSKTSRISGCRGNALADLAHHDPSLHSIPAFSSSGHIVPVPRIRIRKRKRKQPPPHVHKHFLFPIPLSPPALSLSPPPTSLPDFYPSSYLLNPSWTSPPLPRDVSLRATRSNTHPNTSPTSSHQPSPPPFISAGTAPIMKPGTPSPPRKSSQLGSPVAPTSARCLTGLYSSRPALPQSRKPLRRSDISMLSMRTIIRELPVTVASSSWKTAHNLLRLRLRVATIKRTHLRKASSRRRGAVGILEACREAMRSGAGGLMIRLGI